MRWYDDWDDNWRPELYGEERRRIRRQIRQRFRDRLDTQPTEITDEMIAEAEAGAARIAAEGKPPGPFVAFLKEWLVENPETDTERQNRIVANHLRHEVCHSVDEATAVRDEWFVPNDWFDRIWDLAMEEIVARYPELESAMKRGQAAKKAYNRHRSEVRRRAEEDWLRQVTEDEAARKAAQKEYRTARSAACRAVSGMFSVGDAVEVKYRGRMYSGEVTKVNAVTIHVEYALKNGKERAEKVWACDLWEWGDNRDGRDAPEGYVPFSRQGDEIMAKAPSRDVAW